jgi:hypothetical protein
MSFWLFGCRALALHVGAVVDGDDGIGLLDVLHRAVVGDVGTERVAGIVVLRDLDRFGSVAADWRPIRCIHMLGVWFGLVCLGQHVIRKSPMCYIKNITPNKK